MKSKNRILLLTDFSDVWQYTRQPITLESSLSPGQVGSDVDIMHIINTPVEWSKLPLEREKLYPEVKAEIGNARAKLSKMVMDYSREDLKAVESLVFNLGVENIPKHIDSKKYDLIIMGSHGSKGLKPFSIGSNAQSVIRNAEIPVLVVKTPPENEKIGNIVMATTLEEDQRPYYKQLLNFAAEFNADVDLLFVNTPYNFRETKEIKKMHTALCEEGAAKNCENYHVDAYNEERGIQYFMEDSDAEIFAIAKRERSKFNGLFSSSLSEAVVNHLEIAVLVFHV
ncbi:MAG: universal stress protein [Gracilimonas sp.]|nr:universal stress protein [Gracilimonas sp.]